MSIGVDMGQVSISQTVFVNHEGYGSLICPECHAQRTAVLTAYLQHHAPLNVDCPCGHHFLVLLNTRRYYRKSVQLQGVYMPVGTAAVKRMKVEDLSLTGIGFQTILPHALSAGEIIDVRFSLDDSRRSQIYKRATVQWAHNLHVGAEFCDRQTFDKEFGFYLRPT